MIRFVDLKRGKTLAVAGVWIVLACSTMTILKALPGWDQWRTLVDPGRRMATLFLALSVVGVTILRSIRWGLLLKPSHRGAWKKILPVFGWCFILAALSPFRAGEVLRVVWAKRQGASVVKSSGVILVERVADFLVLLFFGGALFLIAPIPFEFRYEILITGGVAALLIVLVAIVWTGFFNELSDLVSLRGVANLLTGTLIIWGMLLSGVYVYLSSFFSEMTSPAPAAAVMTLVNLSGIFMVTPGNLGAYEMAAVIALTCFGFPATESLVAATGLHVVVFSTSMVLGLICRVVLHAQGLRPGELV